MDFCGHATGIPEYLQPYQGEQETTFIDKEKYSNAGPGLAKPPAMPRWSKSRRRVLKADTIRTTLSMAVAIHAGVPMEAAIRNGCNWSSPSPMCSAS